MNQITVFTPTYNRAYCLHKCYESMQRQTCKDFDWLIVDDGSTDNTRDLVQTWIDSSPGFSIRYIYKENGGLHTGYNTAIANADTELCMCIDSDDWVADDAIEKILTLWESIKRDDCAGIIGLDAKPDGTPFCRIQAEGYIDMNEYDLTHKWGGDRKLVVRTDLYKSVAPMPVFENERNFNPQYMHIRIAQDYSFYVFNEVLCLVDYQETGMSAGIFRQYLNSPNSFAEYRRLKMTVQPNNFKNIIRNAIHYDSSCILAGKPRDIFLKSPKKLITALITPLGFLLSLYIKRRAR